MTTAVPPASPVRRTSLPPLLRWGLPPVFFAAALTSQDHARTCLAICAAGLVALLAGVWPVLLCRRSRCPRLLLDDRGAVSTEFVIIIIPFLLLLFGIMQLALASVARILVGHAAFTAARAAIVVLPDEAYEGEAINALGAGSSDVESDFGSSKKLSDIRRAAAITLAPISPSLLDTTLYSGKVSVATAIDGKLAGVGGSTLTATWRGLQKLPYSLLATNVRLEDAAGQAKTSFAYDEVIQVRVTYIFQCRIPLANRFICKTLLGLPGEVRDRLSGVSLAALAAVGRPGYFLALSATHALPNQGRP